MKMKSFEALTLLLIITATFQRVRAIDSDSETTDGIECVTWMYYSNQTNQCVCGTKHHDIVKCNAALNETYILDCHLMTFDQASKQVIAGLSFYGCLNQLHITDIYHLVPANRSQINVAMCSTFHRDGRLCGACSDGYSPLVYSYDLHCKQCSDAENKYNWAIFIAVAFIPLTVFYVLVILFKFNANSPVLQGYVLFAQFAMSPAMIRVISSGRKFGPVVSFLVKLLQTLYGIWNLDYFRILYPDICLRITTLQALTLDYLIAFYPLLLIIITYIAIKLYLRECRVVVLMWKPIKECLDKAHIKTTIKTSMIDVFATFLMLSYNKVLSVSFDLLAFTAPIDSHGKSIGRYLYYDASYEHFGINHLPYGVLAIFTFAIVNLSPFLLLLFYPMKRFQICLNRLKLSRLALHTFVDSFAGCYKDGTEPGTRDCRYFAALFLFLRIVLYIAYQATLTVYFFGWSGLVFAGFMILLLVAQPYKSMYRQYNTVTAVMFGILTLFVIAIMNANTAMVKVHEAVTISAITAGLLAATPQLYAVGLIIKLIYKQKIIKKLFSKTQMMQRSLSESSLLIVPDHHMHTYQ